MASALEEPKQTPAEIPTESKYADSFEFWRIWTDFYHLLMQMQIAIINLQTNINQDLKNKLYIYDKKKLSPVAPPSIPVTIDRSSLTKVKAKRRNHN